MSASFLSQERQLFGLTGGFVNDWHLRSTLPGLYVAGDALFASNCFGHAAATGYYAGRFAARSCDEIGSEISPVREQISGVKTKLYAPLAQNTDSGIGWKELNLAISKAMRNHCAKEKNQELLETGLDLLQGYRQEILPQTYARNPHELMRLLEVYSILDVSEIILHSSLARRASKKILDFHRLDSDESTKEEENCFILVSRSAEDKVVHSRLPLDYYGDLVGNYAKHNP
jgi:succinate dehydrogenase/fumarate reductase flavoprotein subunit